MTDKEHAREYRPELIEIFDDENDPKYLTEWETFPWAARWPIPFGTDEIDIPEDEMWWNY